MRTGERGLDSVLQIFVEPRHDHNSVIKVTWSIQICFMTRMTNKHSLIHSKANLEEKLCTYDGPEYHC